MIAIRRTECPGVLRGRPTDDNYYNNAGVVEKLWNMQRGKCCYCECFIPREGQGKHVEHFRPRSDFSTHRNEWRNLLLACPQCNGQKGDEFPTNGRGRPLLINPSRRNIDPERHINFVASDDPDDVAGLPKARSPRGRKTIEVIGLWLADHVRARNAHFRTAVLPVYRRMLCAKREKHEQELEAAISDFKALMSSRSPFAGFVRSFARNMQVERLFNITIPARHH